MPANLGRARTIASSVVVLAAFATATSRVEGQSAERARALAVDSALRTYLLPGLAEPNAHADVPRLLADTSAAALTQASRLERLRRMTYGLAQLSTQRSRVPGILLECPMPVARDPNRPVMDSTPIVAPGSPVPMPTRRYACENPLR